MHINQKKKKMQFNNIIFKILIQKKKKNYITLYNLLYTTPPPLFYSLIEFNLLIKAKFHKHYYLLLNIMNSSCRLSAPFKEI